MFARLYFPCVPWAVRMYRREVRAARALLHGALFASKHLARLRGRHHAQLQQDMFGAIRLGPRNNLIEALGGSSLVVTISLTLFFTPVIAVGELANASIARSATATALLLGAWFVAAVVLVPVMSASGFWARLAAFAAAIAVAAAVIGVFHHGGWTSFGVQAGILGTGWFLLAWLLDVDRDRKDAAVGRERAASLFLPLFLFAPFLTAQLLIGPGHAVLALVLAGLLSLVVTSAFGMLVLGILTIVGPSRVLAYYATLLSGLTVLLVPITLVPRSPNWAVCAVRGGMLALVGGMLAIVLVSLLALASYAFNGRMTVASDPESQIVRTLVFQVLDLEFGEPAWWTLVVPERADDRAGRRWVRRTLAGRGCRCLRLDRDQVQRLTERQDALIQIFDRYFAPRFRVWHEETNEFVRHQARRMAATMALWQRQILIRGEEPLDRLMHRIVRCLDAAVSRQWDRFDRAEADATSSHLGRRFLTVAKQTVVAVLPLAAVAALVMTPVRLPDALVGSLVTFALTWLAANLLRALDPRASESIDVADKLGRAARGQ